MGRFFTNPQTRVPFSLKNPYYMGSIFYVLRQNILGTNIQAKSEYPHLWWLSLALAEYI